MNPVERELLVAVGIAALAQAIRTLGNRHPDVERLRLAVSRVDPDAIMRDLNPELLQLLIER